MSEFTQEELMHIGDSLLYSIPILSSRKQELMDIRGKVLEMIDNYCDHDWENICCQCALDKIYCYKCEKTLNDNQ